MGSDRALHQSSEEEPLSIELLPTETIQDTEQRLTISHTHIDTHKHRRRRILHHFFLSKTNPVVSSQHFSCLGSGQQAREKHTSDKIPH